MKKMVLSGIAALAIILCFAACENDSTSDSFTEGLIKMVKINGGTFSMGYDDPAFLDNGGDRGVPSHSVTLNSFYMGKYQVTQEQYEDVTGNNPSNHTGPNFPAETVTWYDAVEFCNKLSVKEGLAPVYAITGRTPAEGYPITDAAVTMNINAKGYRLPTEAEWEYACRAGTSSKYSTGDTITTSQAAFGGPDSGVSGKPGITVEVGSFDPNLWGLYDMHGNVYDWCWDWYDVYTGSPATNPAGPETRPGTNSRVARGGSVHCIAENRWDRLSSFFRQNQVDFTAGDYDVGFRVVRSK